MDLFCYDEITPELARTVAETLRAQPTAPVTLRVNSYGGDLAAGLAMLNALRAHRGAVLIDRLLRSRQASADSGRDAHAGRQAV